MKKKFHIEGRQNINDGFQLHQKQGLSVVQFKKELDIFNTSVPIKTTQTISNNDSCLNDTSKIQKSQIICESRQTNQNLRSLKTICKSINKFKTLHNNKSEQKKKKVVNKKKVDQHVRNFARKLARSVAPFPIQEFPQSQKSIKQNFLNKNGIIFPYWAQITQIIINTINFMFLFSLFTFGCVFHQILINSFMKRLEIISLSLIFINLVCNFFVVSVVNGRRLQIIQQISLNYIKGSFFFDFLCLLILVIDLCIDSSQMRFVRILFLCKFGDFKQNIQKLEYNFINTFYKEHYWGIFHIMIENFLVAHVITIILLLMSQLNSETNWIIKAKLNACPWYQQYVWAYYWAVTTMLSIGYGDIVVSNYIQAICMIFVETFSCIILAYTINCVGNLINNLRSKDLQKNKNLKIFKQIVDKNYVSRDVQQKVGCYINQSFQIKTKFNYQDHKKLLNQLPYQNKFDLLKQCNSKIFKSIHIFKSMSQKVISQLAYKIQFKIAHPEQVIFTPSSYRQLLILKEGKVAYRTIQEILKRKYIMNQVFVKKDQLSRVLSLNFLTGIVPKFTVSSLSYSVVFSMPLQTLQQSLRNFQADNQKYLSLKDKSHHILDQFEVIDCPTCKTRHTKADCPKIHYKPLRQTIIFKYIAKCKTCRSERYHVQRQKTMTNCYKLYNKIKLVRFQNQDSYQDNLQKQLNEKSIIELIFNHLVNIGGKKQPKMLTVSNQNTYDLKQITKTSNQYEKSFNDQPKTNSIYFFTNKLIKSLKQNKKHNKNTIYNELKIMMGLQYDSLYDFSHYFVEMNPKNIAQRFNKNQLSFNKTKRGKIRRTNSTNINKQ